MAEIKRHEIKYVPPSTVIIKQKKTSCVRRQNVLIMNLTIFEKMMTQLITGLNLLELLIFTNLTVIFI